MNEKIAQELKKILKDVGVDEEKLEDAIDEIGSLIAEEDVTEEVVNPEEKAPEEIVPIENPEGDAPEETVVVTEDANPDVAPVVEEAETDGSIEAALNDLATQEENAVVPPNAPEEILPPAPPVPEIDPAQVQQLVNDLGEANKTIEALTARIDSLEAALKDSGVISGGSVLGDETPRVTRNANQEDVDVMDDIIATINGNK